MHDLVTSTHRVARNRKPLVRGVAARRWLPITAALLPLLSACSPAEPARIPVGLHSPFTGYVSARYAEPKAWLCRPDQPADACHTDLTTTELRADGTRVVVAHEAAKDPPFDCFYVYPTVDLGFFAKNHDDFEDLAPMTGATVAQVAHFAEACALYVPLYRQVTIGTYLTRESRRERFLAVAFSDVEDAFLQYMASFNHGRNVALIGHSQGAEMVVRLLKRRFDSDPAMRDRLVVAMPIGGQLEVAEGRRTGGTLANIPVCARPEETGCVVGFRSYAAGDDVSPGRNAPSESHETVCVNPAGAGPAYFSNAIFPLDDKLRKRARGLDGVRTPFVAFPNYYAGQCVDGVGGFRYLEVRAAPRPGDARVSPFDLNAWFFETSLGLHVLDFQFAQGDLLELLRTKGAAMHQPIAPSPSAR